MACRRARSRPPILCGLRIGLGGRSMLRAILERWLGRRLAPVRRPSGRRRAAFLEPLEPRYALTGSPITVTDATGVETPGFLGFATFIVSLQEPISEPLGVYFETVDGTALAGSDYQASYGTFWFEPEGDTSREIAVQLNDDAIPEPDEQFHMQFYVSAGDAPPLATATIVDDDPEISINNVTVTEGAYGYSNATFTVSLSRPAPDIG